MDSPGKISTKKGPVRFTLIAQATSLLASLGSVVRWRTLKPSTCQILGNHSPPNLLSQLTARLEFLPESLDKPMFDVLLSWLALKKPVPNS